MQNKKRLFPLISKLRGGGSSKRAKEAHSQLKQKFQAATGASQFAKD